MAGTNPAGDWSTDPDFLTQVGAPYKEAIDGSIATARRHSRAFAPMEQDTPNMTIQLLEGYVWDPTTRTLTEKSAQNTTTITAPSTNPRIDRVVLDPLTGTYSIVTGSEAASPTPPAIPVGKIPVCQIALVVSQTSILLGDITDERATELIGMVLGMSGFLAYNSATDADVTGDGTTVTVDFDTEVFDYGGEFASDVFTATVAGKYLFTAQVAIAGLTASATSVNIDINTSNRNYGNYSRTPYGAGGWTYTLAAIADMDAADTARVRVNVAGEGSKVVDIIGAASPALSTYFSGMLLTP